MTKAKKWVCIGGTVAIAGAGAWGLMGPGKKVSDTVTPNQIEKQSAPIEKVSELTSKEEQPQTDSLKVRKYVVKPGDTLSDIAVDNNIDVETILSANPGTSDLIYPGDELVILPERGAVYEVQAGDSLWRISKNYDVTVENIVKANKKQNDQILVGERLFIPGARFARIQEQRAAQAVSRSSISRFIWPTKGEFSSPFGSRWGKTHDGIDIANEIGTHVMAAAAGNVTWVGWLGGYGYTVMINHGNGFVTLYGHLDNFFVERDQYVRAGQRIASMGNTGNSTGPHLHFEVQKDGKAIDPTSVLP